VKEGELGDDQRALIAPLLSLPLPKQRARPRSDAWHTIKGILWVLRSGASSKQVAQERGGDRITTR
jgi:transposase